MPVDQLALVGCSVTIALCYAIYRLFTTFATSNASNASNASTTSTTSTASTANTTNTLLQINHYTDPFTLNRLPFTKTPVSLSVIIPAYNESSRLPKMLQETTHYLTQRLLVDAKLGTKFTHEIVIVDDGSVDGTSAVACEWAVRNHVKSIKVVSLNRNVGKGGAVTRGMLASSGDVVIFCDADGASQFSDVEKLEAELKRVAVDGLAVATGCRSHLSTDTVVKRSFIRTFLMNSFHAVIHVLGIKGMKDTQCGFKMFTRKAADQIFSNMHVQGWIFDIEVILIARLLDIPVVEVDITWVEMPGSKMSLVKDAIRMLLDLLIIRINYLLGIWKIDKHLKQ